MSKQCHLDNESGHNLMCLASVVSAETSETPPTTNDAVPSLRTLERGKETPCTREGLDKNEQNQCQPDVELTPSETVQDTSLTVRLDPFDVSVLQRMVAQQLQQQLYALESVCCTNNQVQRYKTLDRFLALEHQGEHGDSLRLQTVLKKALEGGYPSLQDFYQDMLNVCKSEQDRSGFGSYPHQDAYLVQQTAERVFSAFQFPTTPVSRSPTTCRPPSLTVTPPLEPCTENAVVKNQIQPSSANCRKSTPSCSSSKVGKQGSFLTPSSSPVNERPHQLKRQSFTREEKPKRQKPEAVEIPSKSTSYNALPSPQRLIPASDMYYPLVSPSANSHHLLCIFCGVSSEHQATARDTIFLPCSHLLTCSRCAMHCAYCPHCGNRVQYRSSMRPSQ